MADKDITIRLVTAADTAGADQAAAAMKGVAAATDQAAAAGDSAFEKMKHQVAAEADAAKARAQHQRERAKQAEETADLQEKELAATKANQQTQIQFMKGEVFAQLASKLAQASAGVREMAASFKETAPEIEAQLKGVADGIETVSSAAQGAAIGFQVAGPMGAAAGAMASMAISAVSDSLKELAATTVRMMEAQQALDNFQTNMAEREIARTARLRTAGMTSLFADQAAAAQDLVRQLNHLSAVQGAKDDISTLKRDRSDAARIAAGDNPAEVKNDRIQDDALDAKNRNNQDVANKLAIRNQALQAAIDADALASDAAGPGKDQATADKLAEEARKKRAAADRAAQDHADAAEIARLKNQGVDMRSTDAMREVAAGVTASNPRTIARAQAAAAAAANRTPATDPNDTTQLLEQLIGIVERQGPGGAAKLADLKRRLEALERREKLK